MSILVKKSTTEIITYKYEIRAEGEFPPPFHGVIDVEIVFLNEKFDHCSFPFRGEYSRENWEILGEINEEISRIEENFAKERNVVDGL